LEFQRGLMPDPEFGPRMRAALVGLALFAALAGALWLAACLAFRRVEAR
jgi:hypothetical protein